MKHKKRKYIDKDRARAFLLFLLDGKPGYAHHLAKAEVVKIINPKQQDQGP